jgi:hypothetical protein
MPLLGACHAGSAERPTPPQPEGDKESGAENQSTEQYYAARVNFDIEPI